MTVAATGARSSAAFGLQKINRTRHGSLIELFGTGKSKGEHPSSDLGIGGLAYPRRERVVNQTQWPLHIETADSAFFAVRTSQTNFRRRHVNCWSQTVCCRNPTFQNGDVSSFSQRSCPLA